MVFTRRQRKIAKAVHAAQNHPSSSNDLEETPPPSTFVSFPRLPAELRVRIWKFVCFEPRNVDIQTFQRGHVISAIPPVAPFPGFGPQIQLHSYFSQTKLPPALHVNQELRAEALKWYKLSFGREVVDRGFTITFPPKIYVNFEVDRLFWMNWYDTFWYPQPPKTHQATELFQLCRSQGLRRLALNHGTTMARANVTSQTLLQQIAFFEEIAFIFVTRYAGPLWENDFLELKVFLPMLKGVIQRSAGSRKIGRRPMTSPISNTYLQ
ncbi:hypothetical protein BKA64DRAFT_15632 [Cadophora sp. MPI-SDFR-AT-0126]|nr:hypothetical protein BKA64DRAFT_15632 [Leotiomycetes sp. MPI-SDFR-AT-0126]